MGSEFCVRYDGNIYNMSHELIQEIFIVVSYVIFYPLGYCPS